MSSLSVNGLKPDFTSPFGTTRMRGMSMVCCVTKLDGLCHDRRDVGLLGDAFQFHLRRAILRFDFLDDGGLNRRAS